MDVKLNRKKVHGRSRRKGLCRKKVGKLERYFRGDAEASVTFRVEKKNCRVELTVHASNTYFRAEETTSDMMASIDAAVATIEGQIRKNKTRLAAAFARMPSAAVPMRRMRFLWKPAIPIFRLFAPKSSPLSP